MLTFIARRTLIAIPILLGLLVLNFFLIRLAPGDPADLYFNPDMTEEARLNMRRSLGLDDPLPVQFQKYITGVVLEFDFGNSFAKKQPVKTVILEALPNTMILSAMAILMELTLGIGVGIISAVRQYSTLDNVSRVTALTFYSMPSFYLGLLFLFLLAGGVWTILPGGGMIDVVRYESMSFFEKGWNRFVHLLLPSITLGLGSAAAVSRYMRGELLEVIRQDYIRTARAKGLRERVVILRHGVRNALIPIITLVGLSLPFLFSGSVIVENVFSWPGMGRVLVDAAFQRDYPMFTAVNVIFGAMVVLGSLVADLLYGVIDPRVRLG